MSRLRSIAATGLFLAGCGMTASAVTPIDSITFSSSDVPEGVGNYTAQPAPGGSISSSGQPGGGYNFNFGVGTSNDKEIVTFSAGGVESAILNLADRVNFVRQDNNDVSGVRELVWYDASFNQSSGQIDVTASRINDMATTLLGPKVSHGTDNAFANNVGANPNNTERIDYIFPTEMVVQDLSVVEPTYMGNADDQLDFGFSIIERGGNDNFQLAPILEVGAEGTPEQGLATKFGELIQITPSDWGGDLLDTDTIVVRGEPETLGNTEFEPSAWVTGQSLAGVFITLRDLGFGIGDRFIGYALFGGDVDPGISYAADPDLYSARLLDTSNEAVFPRDTGSADGGLDLVSGGVVFDVDGVPTTGFITPTPIPTPVIPFGVNPVWGLLVVGLYLWRRLIKKAEASQELTA